MNHLYEQLTALKLTGFRDALKKQLAQPGTYQELGFEERLSLLTAEELTCRENRKAERLIKHHGSDLMLSYQSWIIVTIEGWTGPSSVHSVRETG